MDRHLAGCQHVTARVREEAAARVRARSNKAAQPSKAQKRKLSDEQDANKHNKDCCFLAKLFTADSIGMLNMPNLID